MEDEIETSAAYKAGISPAAAWPFATQQETAMKFSASGHYDRDGLIEDAMAQDAKRRQDEADQVLAAALAGSYGLPCTESHLFPEMACADPGEPMQPFFEPGALSRMWQRVRDHLKAWASWLTAPKPDLS